MNRGKYAAPRRRRRRSTLKPLLVAMAVVLLIGCIAGGTLAWLTSTPSAVTNTFTTSDITITLTETSTSATAEEHNYKMIPGWTIEKDPEVTVKAGSEKCYVFVKVTESDNFSTFMEYDIAEGWTQLKDNQGTEVKGVYYRVVDTNADDLTFSVIGYRETIGDATTFHKDKVLVKSTVTKEMMNALNQATYPTLKFQAAAIQFYKTNNTDFGAYDAFDAIDWDAAAATDPAPDPTTP